MSVRRIRGELRAQLTAGERAFYCFWTGMIVFLPPVVVGFAIFGRGTPRAAWVVLLVVTVIVYAVPISPILKARVRRREARGWMKIDDWPVGANVQPPSPG